MKILRGILAVVVGVIVASVVMLCVEFVNGHHLYPELGRAAEGLTDRESIRALMASAPVGAFLVVIVGWLLGGVAGGYVAARITAVAPMRHALIVGVVLTLLGVANNLTLPPPLWFWVAGLVAFLPAAYAGGRMASRA